MRSYHHDLTPAFLYDPNGTSKNFAHQVFSLIRAVDHSFDLIPLELHRMEDGETEVRIDHSITGKNCFYVAGLSDNPERWLVDLLLVNETLNNCGAEKITDVSPYLRFSRADRKWRSGVSIASSMVAKCLMMYGDEVITFDIHNEASQVAYDEKGKRFTLLYSSPVLIPYLVRNHREFLDDVVVMSPDDGGLKRARAYAFRIGAQTDQAIETAASAKQRNSRGELIGLNLLGMVRDRNVLIIDDIYSSGKTISEAAKQAKDNGARLVYAHTPHFIGTSGDKYITKDIDLLIVGDSLIDEIKDTLATNPKKEMISYAELVAEAILRRSLKRGVSDLLENHR